jgi:secreted trypsin-like serine protease
MKTGRGALVVACALICVAVAVAPAQARKPGGATAHSSIIAGGNADITGFPYAVAIFRKGRMHCGGSVISPTKILTAAHCVEGFDPVKLTVIAGRTRLNDQTTGVVIPVAAAIAHPDYKETQVHDVGVITLASPTTQAPVVLATAAETASLTLPGLPLHVAGWGATNPFGFRLARQLKQTTETVRTDARCRKAYRKLFLSTAMICALGEKLRKFGRPFIHTTACSGDSGGPLVADTPDGVRLVGTVSYGGAFCGLGAAPTVYSRVSDSLAFIQGS